ncbi:hypothetical protein D3C81_752380 [compost metagenome]
MGHHFLVVQDRAGDQVRIKRNEQHVADNTVFFRLPSVGIDKVSDLRKGEEADPKRQCQLQQLDMRGKQRIDICNEKIGILVIAEQQHVAGDAQRKQQFPQPDRLVGGMVNRAPHHVVEGDRRQNERQRLDAPIAVEEQGSRGEP